MTLQNWYRLKLISIFYNAELIWEEGGEVFCFSVDSIMNIAKRVFSFWMFPYIWSGVCETPKLLCENTSKLSFCISHFYTPQSTRSRKESAFEEKQSQRIDVEKRNLKSCFSWLWTLLAQLWRWVQLCSARVFSVWEGQTAGPAAPWHSWDLPLLGLFIAIWALAPLRSYFPCFSRQDCGVGQKNNHLLWSFRKKKLDYFLFVIYLHIVGSNDIFPIQFWFQDD